MVIGNLNFGAAFCRIGLKKSLDFYHNDFFWDQLGDDCDWVCCEHHVHCFRVHEACLCSNSLECLKEILRYCFQIQPQHGEHFFNSFVCSVFYFIFGRNEKQIEPLGIFIFILVIYALCSANFVLFSR